jgi:hypothetical protein
MTLIGTVLLVHIGEVGPTVKFHCPTSGRSVGSAFLRVDHGVSSPISNLRMRAGRVHCKFKLHGSNWPVRRVRCPTNRRVRCPT